jgi:hypothetical protein
MKRSRLQHLFSATSLCAAVALSLSACGGGGDGDSSAPAPEPAPAPAPAPEPAPAPTPAPAPMTLSGTVSIDGRVKNVVVCLDLNTNNACDAGEPASAATGADGAYAVTWDANTLPATQTSVAALIAPVATGTVDQSTTAIDMSAPDAAATTSAYVLKRPAGAGGDINPLTTLVQAGVAAGMTEAVARENAALQLGVAAAKIDGYQDDPAFDLARIGDNARTAARITASALRDGATLSVGDQSAASPAAVGNLVALNYTSASNNYLRLLNQAEQAAGAGVGRPAIDRRSGTTAGVATAHSVLYNQAYLTAQGWWVCDERPFRSMAGNPSRSGFCNDGLPQIGYNGPDNALDGQTMASVLTEMHASPYGAINTGLAMDGLLSAVGTAAFPVGSTNFLRRNLVVSNQPVIWINSLSIDARPQSQATTLDQLVAGYPASAVVLPDPRGTLNLGVTTTVLRNLRVAFKTGNAVQFYECDLDATGANVSNCAATVSGTQAITTVNGVRVMRFMGGPAQTYQNHTRLYAEVDWGGTNGKWVFMARELNTDATSRASGNLRFNPTAGSALKTQLGL